MPYARVGGPVPEAARKGREKQRYEQNGTRMVAGCLPVKVNSEDRSLDGIRVLLISSSQGKGLVFPKGGWEIDESLEAAAARETVEEAGVRGNLEAAALGPFTFVSGKRTHGRCAAYMFAMHVEEELDDWPEANARTRQWCSVEDALLRCRHPWMRDALLMWLQRQGYDTGVLPQVPNGAGPTVDLTTVDPLSAAPRPADPLTAVLT